jgi:hypothetical protein
VLNRSFCCPARFPSRAANVFSARRETLVRSDRLTYVRARIRIHYVLAQRVTNDRRSPPTFIARALLDDDPKNRPHCVVRVRAMTSRKRNISEHEEAFVSPTESADPNTMARFHEIRSYPFFFIFIFFFLCFSKTVQPIVIGIILLLFFSVFFFFFPREIQLNPSDKRFC